MRRRPLEPGGIPKPTKEYPKANARYLRNKIRVRAWADMPRRKEYELTLSSSCQTHNPSSFTRINFRFLEILLQFGGRRFTGKGDNHNQHTGHDKRGQ